MIKVFYDGYGFYRRLHSNCVGTPAIEPLHGDDYLLFDHDIETLNMIGRVTIKALLDINLEKTIVVLTDKDGNPAPMRIDKSRDGGVFEHENGNALKLIFDEPAPLDDVLTTEETLSVSKEKTKLEKQHEAILSVIAIKGFNPMSIPDGEKRTIEDICRADYADLFDGETSFKRAWTAGRHLFKMANHGSYAKRATN